MENSLKSLRNDYRKIVEKYAQDGVKALGINTSGH